MHRTARRSSNYHAGWRRLMAENGGRAMTDKPKPRTVEIVKSDYHPSKRELEEALRVGANFEEAVDALTKPVSIRSVDKPTGAKNG